MGEIQVIYCNPSDLMEYEKDPHLSDDAVEAVAESIKKFGFLIPILIRENGLIVAGKTRRRAALKLGLERIPCIIADGLTETETDAFRLIDNRTGELGAWNEERLKEEIERIGIDFAVYRFEELFSKDISEYIETLLNEDFVDKEIEPTQFSLTFVFEAEHRQAFDNYMKNVGKAILTSKIIDIVEGDGAGA